ncbi:MAG TPA: CsbD family protein [Gemmatimonadaceae bacterium]|nr:CsbD family protein [Gemmatimonadaceae bacterium]
MDDVTRKSGAQIRAEGLVKEIGGKLRSTLGDLTDDHSEKLAGEKDKVKGRAQQKLGQAQQDVEDLEKNS